MTVICIAIHTGSGEIDYGTIESDKVYTLESTMLVAQYIDDISIVKDNRVILTVSAIVGGWKQGNAERTYEIEARVG
jgi:hypothetical protein